MQGDIEEKKKGRKKKRKFGYYLYAIVILLLTVANVTIATLLLTYVQGIEVKGNAIGEKSEIISWIKEDPMTSNSLYTWWKFNSGTFKLSYPRYVESMEVKLAAPWKLRVNVQEKQVVGCMLVENAYVYFDKEGLVLKKQVEYEEGTPLIEGIQVEDTMLYEYLKVDNQKVFSYIVNLTEEINHHEELHPDRITWEDENMNLYFEGVRVNLGKSNYGEKVAQLPAVLPSLKDQRGTLRMEHYTSSNKKFSFEKSIAE